MIRWYNKKHKLTSKLYLTVTIFVVVFFGFTPLSEAGALTNMKDTLVTSRPSVATTISSTININDTTINVGSTLGFAQGDLITICNAGCTTSENRVIAAVPNFTQLALTTGATSSYSSGNVYLKTTTKHTITFTTRSTVNSGKFVITIPGDASPNDQIPGTNGFDFNKITISTSTEYTLTGFTATTMATSTSGGNLVFTFNFTGTVASNTAITIAMGNTNPMLNPTKTATGGTADTYTVKIDEQDSSNNVVDTTSGKVATVESVAVSATINASLAFTINSVASGATVAGNPTNFATSATSVPFGTLNVNATTTGAQFLHIDTNANSGYIVTAQQDGSLRKTNGVVIPDYSTVLGNNEANNGFGYALQNKTGSDASSTFNTSGTFYGAGFSSSTPVTVMSNAGPVAGSEVYVAYRIRISNTQAQGDYKNLITYIATATY